MGNAQPDHLWGDPALRLGLDVKALRGQLGQIVPGQARCQDEARGLPRLGAGVDSIGHTRGGHWWFARISAWVDACEVACAEAAALEAA